MKLGIYLNAQHPAADDPARRFAETVEQVRLIKKLGFDSIWSGEHHVTDDYHYYPLLPMLQRLSAEAEGLEIGTNIVLLPLHNPIELAEIGAFMDVITGGRFLLGVGLGYRAEEFAMFGVDMKSRVSRFTEHIEIIKRLWTEDKVTHKGRHYQFENLTIRPQPTAKPRPPIIIAAHVDASVERAGAIGDGWTSVPTTRVDEVARHLNMYKTARAAAGLPASQHLVRLFEVSCAPDVKPPCAAPRRSCSPSMPLMRRGACQGSTSARRTRPRCSSRSSLRTASPSARPRKSRIRSWDNTPSVSRTSPCA